MNDRIRRDRTTTRRTHQYFQIHGVLRKSPVVPCHLAYQYAVHSVLKQVVSEDDTKKKVTNALAIIPPNNVEPSAALDAAPIACVMKKLGMNVERNYEGKSSIKGWVGVGKGELRSEILPK